MYVEKLVEKVSLPVIEVCPTRDRAVVGLSRWLSCGPEEPFEPGILMRIEEGPYTMLQAKLQGMKLQDLIDIMERGERMRAVVAKAVQN